MKIHEGVMITQLQRQKTSDIDDHCTLLLPGGYHITDCPTRSAPESTPNICSQRRTGAWDEPLTSSSPQSNPCRHAVVHPTLIVIEQSKGIEEENIPLRKNERLSSEKIGRVGVTTLLFNALCNAVIEFKIPPCENSETEGIFQECRRELLRHSAYGMRIDAMRYRIR